MYTRKQYSHKYADQFHGPVKPYEAPVIDWNHDQSDTLYWKIWLVDLKANMPAAVELPADAYEACLKIHQMTSAQ